MIRHETHTLLSPEEVITRARAFFPHAGAPYAASPEKSGARHAVFHLEVGEIVIGAMRQGDHTLVRATASRGLSLVNRFLTSLSAPLAVSETRHRHREHRRIASRTHAPSLPKHEVAALGRADAA